MRNLVKDCDTCGYLEGSGDEYSCYLQVKGELSYEDEDSVKIHNVCSKWIFVPKCENCENLVEKWYPKEELVCTEKLEWSKEKDKEKEWCPKHTPMIAIKKNCASCQIISGCKSMEIGYCLNWRKANIGYRYSI